MNEELKVADNTVKDCDMETGATSICAPITSLNELQQCLKEPPPWTNSIIKLKSRSDHVIKNSSLDCHNENHNFFPKERLYKKIVPKTLVCHDMKNGYLEDKYISRVNIGNGYTFYRWSQIDIFVYFSHHFITIPPLSWINLAHKNGVPILGTFITEWVAGEAICNQILRDVHTLKATADALVEISLLFKLDGWLLNIENKVNYPENLQLFVRYLTDNLHKKQERSYIIWYDSVTKTGELKWQNELNKHNRCYFDACDGIFLNYTWNETNLEKTVKEAQHRILDVYVGLDIFGRGCFGGGKFKSHVAAEAVRKFNLSLAIFAQGWTHETLEKEPEHTFLQRFHRRDNILWNSLWPYLYSHPIKYVFETIFHTGVNSDFYDLQAQTFQLTNFLSCDAIDEVQNSDRIKDKCVCLKDNIEDATKVCQVSNKTLDENKTYVHRLFSTEIFLDRKFILYCYTKSSQTCDYYIILLLQNKYKHITKIICYSNQSMAEDYRENIVQVVPILNNSHLRKENIPEDWDLRAFEISFKEDTLLEIALSIVGKNSIDLCGFGIKLK